MVRENNDEPPSVNMGVHIFGFIVRIGGYTPLPIYDPTSCRFNYRLLDTVRPYGLFYNRYDCSGTQIFPDIGIRGGERNRYICGNENQLGERP